MLFNSTVILPDLTWFCSVILTTAVLHFHITVYTVSTHQNRIRVMPAVPKDPEPHDTTDKLRLKLLLLRQLRVLSVLWLNVRSATRPDKQIVLKKAHINSS